MTVAVPLSAFLRFISLLLFRVLRALRSPLFKLSFGLVIVASEIWSLTSSKELSNNYEQSCAGP